MLKVIWEKILNLKKRLGKWFWVLPAIVAVILFKIIFPGGKVVKYAATKVSKGDLLETVSTTGKVQADEYANLTFQTGGRLSWVNVKKGDSVKKGQAIAGLDTVVLNSAYAQALNNYRNYQAAAESALDSVKGHSGDETFAQKATRTAAEVARDNAYDAMNATLQNLKFANLYSPFDGVVAEATPSFAGANITPATSSYIVVNPETTYFQSEIAETDLPKVKIGQKVKIKLDAYPDGEIDGTIANMGIVAFNSSTGGNAYTLRVELPENKDFKFKVGMEGDMDIILETISGALKVPTSALVNEEDINYVWVYKGGKVHKKEIQIGGNSNEETEIKSGVSEGDVIITEPSNKFKEGQKVSI